MMFLPNQFHYNIAVKRIKLLEENLQMALRIDQPHFNNMCLHKDIYKVYRTS